MHDGTLPSVNVRTHGLSAETSTVSFNCDPLTCKRQTYIEYFTTADFLLLLYTITMFLTFFLSLYYSYDLSIEKVTNSGNIYNCRKGKEKSN